MNVTARFAIGLAMLVGMSFGAATFGSTPIHADDDIVDSAYDSGYVAKPPIQLAQDNLEDALLVAFGKCNRGLVSVSVNPLVNGGAKYVMANLVMGEDHSFGIVVTASALSTCMGNSPASASQIKTI